MSEYSDVRETVYDSPWRNAYWFTRNLLNTDKYGALGKDEKLMQAILTESRAILTQPLSDADKLTVCLKLSTDKIKDSAKPNSKAQELREQFVFYLRASLKTPVFQKSTTYLRAFQA